MSETKERLGLAIEDYGLVLVASAAHILIRGAIAGQSELDNSPRQNCRYYTNPPPACAMLLEEYALLNELVSSR